MYILMKTLKLQIFEMHLILFGIIILRDSLMLVIYKRNELIDIIFIDNIEQEPNLLKMSPSIWNKIYKRGSLCIIILFFF